MGIERIAHSAFAEVVDEEHAYSFRRADDNASWIVSNPYYGTLWTVALFSSDVESIVAYPTTERGLRVLSNRVSQQEDPDAELALGKEALQLSDRALVLSVNPDGTIVIPDEQYDIAALFANKIRAQSNGGGWNTSMFGTHMKDALTQYGESFDGSDRWLS